jgi:hypothetical protein
MRLEHGDIEADQSFLLESLQTQAQFSSVFKRAIAVTNSDEQGDSSCEQTIILTPVNFVKFYTRFILNLDLPITCRNVGSVSVVEVFLDDEAHGVRNGFARRCKLPTMPG